MRPSPALQRVCMALPPADAAHPPLDAAHWQARMEPLGIIVFSVVMGTSAAFIIVEGEGAGALAARRGGVGGALPRDLHGTSTSSRTHARPPPACPPPRHQAAHRAHPSRAEPAMGGDRRHDRRGADEGRPLPLLPPQHFARCAGLCSRPPERRGGWGWAMRARPRFLAPPPPPPPSLRARALGAHSWSTLWVWLARCWDQRWLGGWTPPQQCCWRCGWCGRGAARCGGAGGGHARPPFPARYLATATHSHPAGPPPPDLQHLCIPPPSHTPRRASTS